MFLGIGIPSVSTVGIFKSKHLTDFESSDTVIADEGSRAEVNRDD